MVFLRFVILALTAINLVWSQSDENSLPLKISPVISRTCSVRPLMNATNPQMIETVNRLINERYGGPSCTCSNTRSWKRVVYFNMTDTAQQCPSNWKLIETPIRGCTATTAPGCHSAIFSVNSFTYNRVCGRVIGYQKGSSDAFDSLISSGRTIEEPYVDGLSLTHGAPGSRQHVWTFAASLYENDPGYVTSWNCECTNTNYNWPYQVPSFVGNNYFCETGNTGPGYEYTRVYSTNPLWDGKGCGPSSTCCQLHSPPWFCTSLPQSVSDYLELRICLNQPITDEDLVVSFVELYIARD